MAVKRKGYELSPISLLLEALRDGDGAWMGKNRANSMGIP
jgi:hypothetical protein